MQIDLNSLGLEHLSRKERLQLIDILWESLGDHLEPDEIPDWHHAILDQRLADMEANPTAGRPWREVLDDIERRL